VQFDPICKKTTATANVSVSVNANANANVMWRPQHKEARGKYEHVKVLKDRQARK
jgi:hypothetical protein